jgi:hypothetical protein
MASTAVASSSARSTGLAPAMSANSARPNAANSTWVATPRVMSTTTDGPASPGREMRRARSARSSSPRCGTGNRPFTPSAIQRMRNSPSNGAVKSRCHATMSSQSGTA